MVSTKYQSVSYNMYNMFIRISCKYFSEQLYAILREEMQTDCWSSDDEKQTDEEKDSYKGKQSKLFAKQSNDNV